MHVSANSKICINFDKNFDCVTSRIVVNKMFIVLKAEK